MNQDQKQPMTNFAKALKDDCDHDMNQDQDLDLWLQRSSSSSEAEPYLPEDDEFLCFIKSVIPEEQAWKQEQEFERLPIRHRF
jgi:hypothetical protein